MLDAWRARAVSTFGRRVEWDVAGVTRHGVAEDIDETGALLVRDGADARACDLGRGAVAVVDDYCRQVEAYLCRKNDGHLVRIVGPAFEQVCGWATGACR